MNRTPRLSKSGIEYLDYVWNFASGCTKGCSYCYAKKIATRFPGHYPNGFEPTLYPEAFTSPWHLRKPSTIGVCFMGDLFDDAIDPNALVTWGDRVHSEKVALRRRIFWTIQQAPQHRFLFLTKQPQNLAKWSPFPDNCWVGVSVTGSDGVTAALAALNHIVAPVKYLSLEPLLGPVAGFMFQAIMTAVDWVIIGAQTKPAIQPKLEWVEEIVGAADRAGIPVFLKDSLAGPRISWNGGPPYYRREIGTWVLRQDLPKGV